MIYSIQGGLQKDILANDVVEIEKGVLDKVSALVVVDVSDPAILHCARINFDTMEISEPISISSSWATNVWRPI